MFHKVIKAYWSAETHDHTIHLCEYSIKMSGSARNMNSFYKKGNLIIVYYFMDVNEKKYFECRLRLKIKNYGARNNAKDGL